MTHRAKVTPSTEDCRSGWNLESTKGCQCVSVDSPLPSCDNSLSGPHRHLQSEQLLMIMVMNYDIMAWKDPEFYIRCL